MGRGGPCVVGSTQLQSTPTWVRAQAPRGRRPGSRRTPSTSLTSQRETAKRWVTGKLACVIPGEALGGCPGPWSLLCWRCGPRLPFLPLLFPLSTARKTPHCMSASLPRVPGAALSTTSTRYEPLCDKALGGHAIFSPTLRTEAAGRPSPVLGESSGLHLTPPSFPEHLTASADFPRPLSPAPDTLSVGEREPRFSRTHLMSHCSSLGTWLVAGAAVM